MEDLKHKSILEAAEYFKEVAMKFTATERGIHAETVILATARMSGSLMFRSFNTNNSIAAGTTVLSEESNIYGPKLMNLLFVTLDQLGHQISQADLNSSDASSELSRLTFEEVQNLLNPFYLTYCETAKKESNLNLQDMATAALIATAMLIHDCQSILDVKKGSSIAVWGLVEGTKTMPYEWAKLEKSHEVVNKLNTEKSGVKKPWYKLW